MNLFPWQANGSNGGARLPHILLEDNPEVGPSDGSNRKYHRPPAHYDDPAWHLGWTDGRLGQPQDPDAEVLRAQAAVDRQEEIRKVRSQLATAQAHLEPLKTRLKEARDKLNYAQSYYLGLWERRNKNVSWSSLPLALTYLVFGLLLFLADVPLSMTLVADGFKIPTSKLLPDGRRVDVDMIFSDTWLVLNTLWQPLSLALGIALMGIVVKFVVDTLVFHDDDDDPPLTKKRVIGVTVPFLLFFAATLSLGLFRTEIMKNVHKHTQIGEWTFMLTFIFLTLVFPIAGGLCFSAGWRRLERAKHYYSTLLRLRWLERQYRKVDAARSQWAERVNELEQLLEPDGVLLADSVAELRRSLYLHGYQRGQSVPETLDAGETLYGLCDRTLKRVLAKKVRHKLQLEP